MALPDDDSTDGFSFIWEIHHFSHCLQKTGEFLCSPRFFLNSNDPEVFGVALFPQGLLSINKNHVRVFLVKEKSTNKQPRVDVVLSIRTVRGSYKKVSEKEWDFSIDHYFCLPLASRREIFKKGTDAYLDNDILTIRLRIIKVDDIFLESEQCYARTIIKVERAIYTWNLKTLSDLEGKDLETKEQINLPEINSFTVSVSLTKGISSEVKFEMIIKRTNTNKLYFATCAISLLDSGKVLQSVQNKHWFKKSNSEQIWKSYLLTNSKLNSAICLHCEFNVSFGVEYSTIEKVVRGSIVDRPKVFLEPTLEYDHLGAWKENLRRFYSEGKCSDFTIRTAGKEFPVHKAMLCAQSPVFCAMFEHDLKENRTGMVEIEDLEDDTVSGMLLFVYTSSVENLDWEMLSKLYFAADKYEMTALKEKCSIFLKGNLTTSNACECLVLADMHQDQDLKTGVQDFVAEHSPDIINSDEWKKLMKENLPLAAETMHLIINRNLNV